MNIKELDKYYKEQDIKNIEKYWTNKITYKKFWL